MSFERRDSHLAIKEGVQACRRGEWRTGLHVLSRIAREQKSEADALPSIFYSYLGIAMARCEGRKRDAIELCRYAVKLSPRNPENRANLATAYIISKKRRQAVKQLQLGLRLAPRNRHLRNLAREIGTRRPSAIGFLSRDNPLNVWIGRLTYDPQREQAKLEGDESEDEPLEWLVGRNSL